MSSKRKTRSMNKSPEEPVEINLISDEEEKEINPAKKPKPVSKKKAKRSPEKKRAPLQEGKDLDSDLLNKLIDEEEGKDKEEIKKAKPSGKRQKKNPPKPIEEDPIPIESSAESGNEEEIRNMLEEEIKESQIQQNSFQYFQVEEWTRGFEWDDEIDRVNKEVFRNKSFINRQREIINATKAKRDTIALIPTGHGKSLTFQLPAYTDKGISIVVMPLLSLIEDQVQKLKEIGVKSVFIHPTQEDIKEILAQLKKSLFSAKIFFVTPEQLMQNEYLKRILSELYDKKLIERFVLDEVHCLPTWGKDFRNDYMRLQSIRTLFPETPILGLTATATPKVVNEIKERLQMRKPLVFSISFNRKNLFFNCIPTKKKDRAAEVSSLLKKDYKYCSGIIYCSTIKECEELCKKFKYNEGINCASYHGKMDIEKRNEIQLKWRNDEILVMIATIAFGMGVDKKDVRFVIHMSLPRSLDGYIQEGGRAGRDHQLSHVVLFFEYNDRSTINWFIKNNDFADMEREQENLTNLYNILDYAEDPYECRRVKQLQYLDEVFDREKCNQMCNNCRDYQDIYYQDFSTEAQMICELFEELCNEEGKQITVNGLLKLLTPKPPTNDDNDSTCAKLNASLAPFSKTTIRRVIIKMLSLQILKENLQTFQNNPTVTAYLKSGTNFYSCLEGLSKIEIATGTRRKAKAKLPNRNIKIKIPKSPKKTKFSKARPVSPSQVLNDPIENSSEGFSPKVNPDELLGSNKESESLVKPSKPETHEFKSSVQEILESLQESTLRVQPSKRALPREEKKDQNKLQSPLAELIEKEYEYADITSFEEGELLERLLLVKKNLQNNISLLNENPAIFKEFNTVFSLKFFANIIEQKPFYLKILSNCLEEEAHHTSNSYKNYSEIFMHEIFHFCHLRNSIKQLGQKEDPEILADDEESVKSLVELNPVNHDHSYLSKKDLKKTGRRTVEKKKTPETKPAVRKRPKKSFI
ncbi:unnamed protein product [Moneuplotes crassus]|uniref:ATP-dependent DNA helicase n=2 Tax=Euplotes crassus TaxID=5936 RepID=A0AAD2D3K5_EUPCR|nr:unnamed protein product [Moneuplotes crassus]